MTLLSERKLTRQQRWQRKNPEKRAAHEAVRDALRRGQLTRQPCEICGSTENVDAHHRDYNFPLRVTWLCRLHHMREHRRPIYRGISR